MPHFMTIPKNFPWALLLTLPLIFSSCKDDDDALPPPPNQDGEVITTVRYTLTPVGGGTALTAQYRDLDGDGGTAPVLSYPAGAVRLTLTRAQTYTGALLLLDESKSPVDTISNEVLAEANDHLFVYRAAPVGLLSITRTDRDTNAPPLEIGLATRVVAGAAPGVGTLQVVLKHQPGAKTGAEAPGDTDVDVTFAVEIQ